MAAIVQSNILYPLDQIAFDNSQAGVNQAAKPTWIVGQTVTVQPLVPVGVASISQARNLFGTGSMLALMFEAYFNNDSTGPIYCLPVADAAGATKAAGTMAITGPATANGTLNIAVTGVLAPVGVSAGDTPTVMAANAAAAVNANPNLPVVATSATGTLTLTAKNGGTLGNMIDLRINPLGISGGQVLPAGVAVAVTAMTGGATDPQLSAGAVNLAGILGDLPMRFLVHPYTDTPNLTAVALVMAFSGGRWDATRKTWGHAFSAHSDTFANLVTFGTGLGANENDPHTSIFAYEPASPTWEPVAAAIWAGAMAPSLRTQPNRPVQSLALNGFTAPPNAGAQFTKAGWQTLLGLGLGLAKYGTGTPTILRAVTTYQFNSFGQADQSYFDTEDLFLLAEIGDRIEAMNTQQFSRSLVADTGTKFGPGLPIVTPATYRASLLALYLVMQNDGLVEDADAMLAATVVSRNANNPSELDALFAPFLVVGLRQIGVTIQFRKYSAAAAAAFGG